MMYFINKFGILHSFEEFLTSLKEMLVDIEDIFTREIFKLFSRKVISGATGNHFSGAKLEPGPKRTYTDLRHYTPLYIYMIMKNGGSDWETCMSLVNNICLLVFSLAANIYTFIFI